MVNRNLIRGLDYDDELMEQELAASLADMDPDDPNSLIAGDVTLNTIVVGKILRVDDEFVLLDVGYKSEGQIHRNEWDEHEPPPEPGQTVRVLIEDVEDATDMGEESRGMISLSKRKAKKIDDWEAVMKSVHEGDIVNVVVLRKIKGGLLVDLNGVNVFLPASQVDVRRPSDIGDYVGRTVECIVLKIDDERRNIVVSRRALIEKVREKQREELLKTLEVGQIRKGVVKNIADFGAFVDLGGIDGLLHITDMSWGRINHPTEMVQIDQELEVSVVLCGGGVFAVAIVDEFSVLSAPVLLHVLRPLGVLFGAFVCGHVKILAMVKGVAAAPAREVRAVEKRGET